MSKEGYLQLKINELETKLNEKSEEIKEVLLRIQKEKEIIIKLLEQTKPRINELNETVERRKDLQKRIEEEMRNVELFHKKHYSKMRSSIIEESNRNLEGIKLFVNEVLEDHLAIFPIMTKILVEKGIFTVKEWLKYVDDNWDLVKQISKTNTNKPINWLRLDEEKNNG